MRPGRGLAVENCCASLCFSMIYECLNERHDYGNRVRPRRFREARRLRQCPVRRVAVRGVAQLEIVVEVVTKELEGASRNLWDQARTSRY